MTYVVSDIHGRKDRFHNILERIRFKKTDVLYILGDVIDRNPDGISILSEIMKAENMLMILGNHEYMMMNVVQTPPFRIDEKWEEDLGLWFLNGGEMTYRTFLRLSDAERAEIMDYVNDLPLNREIEIEGKSYLLVHGSPAAAYTKENPDYMDKTMYAVWNRFDPFIENGFAGKNVICGHTPTIFFTDRKPMEVFINGNTVCMDCGCAFPDGRLACLCLETGEIVYSRDKC